MARFIFLDETARDLYGDWAAAARGIVGSVHPYAGRHPSDPQLAELIGDLSVHDADFRRWWDYDVYTRTHGTKHHHHPVVGDDPDQTLGLHTAEPGSASEQALKLLASWTGNPLATTQTRDTRSVK